LFPIRISAKIQIFSKPYKEIRYFLSVLFLFLFSFEWMPQKHSILQTAQKKFYIFAVDDF